MRSLIAIGLLAFGGCNAPGGEQDAHVGNDPSVKEWEYVSITWNELSIGVDTVQDSLLVSKHEWLPDSKKQPPDTVIQYRIYVAPASRDSIWMLARRIVASPTIVEGWATDRSGDYFRLKLYAHGTEETLVYHSQAGWPDVADLVLLKSLTFDRIPRP